MVTPGPLLVGLDMGSTNVKAVVYEPDGRTVALASMPAITHYPRPAWAYYEPDELWESACRVLREAIGRVDDPRRIAGIAVASVGEAGITVDAHGSPTYEAIAWFDRRTIGEMDRVGQLIGEDALFATTGLALHPIFSLFKMLWIKHNQPDAWARTAHWLMIADYIAFRLSGAMATDFSLASRSMAFDLHRLEWAKDLLTDVDIPSGLLPPTTVSGTRIGGVTAEAAAATGLPIGAAVATGGQDHVCGALAAGAIGHGQMLDSMGTAEALFCGLDRPLRDPTLGRVGYTQGAHVVPGGYYVYGGVYTSGASIDWFANTFGDKGDLPALLEAAKRVPPGSHGAMFVPHLRLAAAPHADARARAAFVGLTSDHDRGTLTRAVCEGLAYEARCTMEPLLAYAGLKSFPEIAVIGGGTKNELLIRIKAAVMNARLRVLDLDEATALGAAMLGGIGAGVFENATEALATIAPASHVVEPDPADVAVYASAYEEVYRGLYDTLRATNHLIHAQQVSRNGDAA